MTITTVKPSKLTLADESTNPDADQGLPSGWEGIIGFEDVQTGDDRIIDPGALAWETPFIMRFVEEDVGLHDGARAAGTCLHVERRDGGAIWARGTFDLGGEAGREAARLVAAEVQTGISMDLDESSFEIREEEEDESDEDDPLESLFDPEGILAITEARIRGITLVSIPAFKDANISAVFTEYEGNADEDEDEDDDESDDGAESLEASGAPIAPPVSWFDDPHLKGPTPLRIDESGQIYGHLATWGVCHTAQPGGPGTCVTAPTSETGYAWFHVGTLKTAEGDVISIGHITMNTDHAGKTVGMEAARSHYDDTGTAVADVRAGEDEFGIWVAGALRPGVTKAQARELRASPLSGDWRRVDGNLELTAALAVNVPGFPVPRPAGMVASGALSSLVASGMLAPNRVRKRSSSGAQLSSSDLRYLKALADRERAAAHASLSARVNRARVEAMASKRRKAKV